MRLETGKLSVSYVRSESETAFVIQITKGIRGRFEYMNFKKNCRKGFTGFPVNMPFLRTPQTGKHDSDCVRSNIYTFFQPRSAQKSLLG